MIGLKQRNALMNVNRFFLLVLPVAVLLSSCTYNKNLQPAQATANTGEGGFELADVNHDGKLSRAEASDFLVEQIFNASDLNHDGKITKAEWTSGDPTTAGEFEKRDLNHDGVVTREEALKYGRKHGLATKAFREADKNGDGYLSKAEVQAYYASREGPPG
jgi:hypothetical protein